MNNSNPFRLLVLGTIDNEGVASATAEDVAEHWRHANHLANWCALWNLVATGPDAHGVTSFRRRATTEPAAQRKTPQAGG